MTTDAADACYESEVPSLVITSGNDSRRRIPVPSTGVVLGREGKFTSIFRDDPLVSRGHAHVYLAEDHSVQVADLNSTNGTFVNGEAIRSLTRLADRDVLRIGSIDMRLDSPRADNQPAAETVRLPAARVGWPDPAPGDGFRQKDPATRMTAKASLAGAWPDAGQGSYRLGEAPPASAATYPPRTYAPAGRIRSLSDRPGQRSAGTRIAARRSLRLCVGRMRRQRANDGLTEPPPASAVAAAPPDARTSAPADTTDPVSFAPHPLRLLAFTIDLFLRGRRHRGRHRSHRVAAGVRRRAADGLGHLPDRVGVADRRPHRSARRHAAYPFATSTAPPRARTWPGSPGRSAGPASATWSSTWADWASWWVLATHGDAVCTTTPSPARWSCTPTPTIRCIPAAASNASGNGYSSSPRTAKAPGRPRRRNTHSSLSLWKWLVRITDISLAGLQFARDRWHALVQRLAATAHPDHQCARGQRPDRREDHHPGRHHQRRHRHSRRRRRDHLSGRAHRRRLG